MSEQVGTGIEPDVRIAFDLTDDGLTDLIRTAIADCMNGKNRPRDYIVRLESGPRFDYSVPRANLIRGAYIARHEVSA